MRTLMVFIVFSFLIISSFMMIVSFPLDEVQSRIEDGGIIEPQVSSTYNDILSNIVSRFNELSETAKSLSPHEKMDKLLISYIETGEIPENVKTYPSREVHELSSVFRKLSAAGKNKEIGIIILADYDVSLDQVSKYVTVRRVYPLGFGFIIIASAGSPGSIERIAEMESVIGVLSDIRIGYPREKPLTEELKIIDTNQMFATYIQGSANATSVYNVNGSGVVIAIVDTGVDFGNPDLRQARAPDGRPVSIDIDGLGIGLATLLVQAVDVGSETATLPTNGQEVIVYSMGEYYEYTFSYDITISRAQYDMSKSKYFRVGVFSYTDSSLYYTYYMPFVMIDSTTSGVYDTVYFDLSTLYGEALLDSGDPLGLFDIDYIDYSVADESPHRWGDGTEVIARDFTGDGIPDISMGSLAWSYDTYRYGGLGLIPGIGAVDNQTSLDLTGVYDEWPVIAIQWARDDSHGTCAAGSAASMGLHDWFLYNESNPSGSTSIKIPGMAPGASIMAINPWYFGDMISAWFWAAGLDYNENTGGYDYNEWHHADICSNSWGISEYTYGGMASGSFVLELLADLLTIPGYFNSSYPGMVFTVAAGNGGFGYGTLTTPASASLVISVGASTEWLYWTYYGNYSRPQGVDEVIPWSNRGPTTMGEPKPDVVAIGAFAADINAINYMGAMGYEIGLYVFAGDGYYTTELFGGTSQATPMTAGAVAVIIEALEKNGISWDPLLVKNILMSTADDLGYDPYVQGAGRINILRAVNYVFEMKGKSNSTVTDSVLAYTYDSWRNILTFKKDLYVNLTGVSPTDKIGMASLYGGILLPGESKTYHVAVDTYIHNVNNLTLKPMFFNRTAYAEIPYYARAGEDAYAINLTETLASYGISKDAFFSSDLVLIYVTIDGCAFSEGYISSPYIYLVDWLDENGDGKYDHSVEMHRINVDFRDAPVMMVSVGQPAKKFSGTPTLVIRQVSQPGLAMTIYVMLFKRVTWSVFTVGGYTNTSLGDDLFEYNFSVTLNVPSNSMPGVYEGIFYIHVSNATNSSEYYMPVSYAVMHKLDTVGKVYIFRYENRTEYTPYVNFRVFGGQFWGWRWESGDFRFYPLLVQDSNSEGLLVDITWNGDYSQVDVIVVFNNSYIV
ncbi:MAG: S8 family serine peptidase, partial [Candidatus Asgardarchaeum sp.]